MTMFLINYGDSVPKIGSVGVLHELFTKQCKIDMHLFDDYFAFPNEEIQLIAYVTYIRNLLFDVQFVLSGFETFDAHYAQLASTLLCFGLKEEKPHDFRTGARIDRRDDFLLSLCRARSIGNCDRRTS